MQHTNGTLVLFIAILILGVTEMNVFGFLGFGNTASWKEEVLLHDGSPVIVERTQTYGGYPTLESRERKLLEEEWTFTMPDSKQRIKWKNDAHRPPEGMSLTLILLDFLNNTPYIATVPAGCISYNYWGRPNPPYVFFKLNGDVWQRITLAEFPADFKETNVVIGRPDPPNRSGKLCIAKIKEENRNLEPHLRIIAREPVRTAQTAECEELIYYKGGWIMPNDPAARKIMDIREQKEKK